MSKRTLTAISLGLMNMGIFIGTVVFLPSPSSWTSYGGPISSFINSRTDWDVAWGVLVATVVFSVGIFLMLEALGAFGRSPRDTED